MANNQIKIDRIAIWRPAMNLDEGVVNTQVTPPGVKYLPKGSSAYAISTEPMYRYVKNYHIGKGKNIVKYSLFVRTFSDAEAAVETQMDAATETLTEEYIKKIVSDPDVLNFEYLDIYLTEEN